MGKICGDEDSGCDLGCMDCEIPTIEPEYCESCYYDDEKNGIEYEFNPTHESGSWQCGNCRGGM